VTEQDFLSQIKNVEQQAAALVMVAQEKARQEQEQAQHQAAELIAQAKAAAEDLSRQLLTTAEEEADQITQEAARNAVISASAIKEAASGLLSKAVIQIAERIVSGHADR
jgi:vacuolar-type H+-ATPase subunit H